MFLLFLKIITLFCLFSCLFYEKTEKRKRVELGVEGGVEKLRRTKWWEILVRLYYMKNFQLKINVLNINSFIS